MSAETCIDCDRSEIECVCENRPRCSCGVPILSCMCAYGPSIHQGPAGLHPTDPNGGENDSATQ